MICQIFYTVIMACAYFNGFGHFSNSLRMITPPSTMTLPIS